MIPHIFNLIVNKLNFSTVRWRKISLLRTLRVKLSIPSTAFRSILRRRRKATACLGAIMASQPRLQTPKTFSRHVPRSREHTKTRHQVCSRLTTLHYRSQRKPLPNHVALTSCSYKTSKLNKINLGRKRGLNQRRRDSFLKRVDSGVS